MVISEQIAGHICPNVPKCGQWRTGMTERWKREKKKSRHPAEQQPGYKSLNCEQKGESPSAAELLLFHCAFSRPVLHWTSSSQRDKTTEERLRNQHGMVCKKSNLNSKNHDTLDCRLCRFFWDFHCKFWKNQSCSLQQTMFEKTNNKLLFVYWLACWEIPKIRLTGVNECDPFPLAMGDSAHEKKKGLSVHGFRGKLHYDSEADKQETVS